MNRINFLIGSALMLLLLFGFSACEKPTSNSYQSSNVNLKGDHMTFTFTTSNLSGRYAPRYVMAVWVEDSIGEFVTSLAVYAQARKQYLVKWYGASRGITADAITGATVMGSQTYKLAWDLKDYNGKRVPEGTYKILMEETSNDAAGPETAVSVEVGNTSYSASPKGSSHFKQLSVDFIVADTSAVTTQAIGSESNILN
ncbi:DUF2271 domain-containing protein [Saccharicrinis sp. FJH54]|uniref:DUF2271 domain-containing protein n=1 Tax=Saccharicrinis sp. FJH54 TaxID=3344665 RepID=UPI0035D44A33